MTTHKNITFVAHTSKQQKNLCRINSEGLHQFCKNLLLLLIPTSNRTHAELIEWGYIDSAKTLCQDDEEIIKL